MLVCLLLAVTFKVGWPHHKQGSYVGMASFALNLTLAKRGATFTLVWLLLASSCSKFCPPVAHKKVRMASSCHKFYPPVAPPTTHKGATLVWFLIALNFTRRLPTKRCATSVWLLLALNFSLRWPQHKQELRWYGFFFL